MIVGHTHRVSNLMRRQDPGHRGHQRRCDLLRRSSSWSKGGDVAWAGGATRVAKNLGVAKRPDVQAIVDDANAETAVLRNQVIGTQSIDILRDPTRLHESAMGNMVADAMRGEVPGRRRRHHELGRPAAGHRLHPAERGEAAGEITWGEMFARPAVRQPHGDLDADGRAADARRS